MPRFLSAVTILSSFAARVLTHTWSTFFLSGASQARRLPSGESCGAVRSGLPNSTSRGMSGGSCAKSCAAASSSSEAMSLMRFMRVVSSYQSVHEKGFAQLPGVVQIRADEVRPQGGQRGEVLPAKIPVVREDEAGAVRLRIAEVRLRFGVWTMLRGVVGEECHDIGRAEVTDGNRLHAGDSS